MRKPHVENLYYKLKTDDTVSYKQPSPIDFEREEFKGHLEDNLLTCEMKKHYSSLRSARAIVESFLKAWEIKTSLNRDRGELKFIYDDAEIIDRNPPDGSKQVTSYASEISISTILQAKPHVTRGNYPDPPKYFKWSPDVDTLWGRYENYLDGKELLLPMAYFCLTLVESKARGSSRRKKAAKMYHIEDDVLDKLGELTSTKGDLSKEARKAGSQGPLTEKERKWIEEAIKKLIYQVGKFDNRDSLEKLKMSDLPDL